MFASAFADDGGANMGQSEPDARGFCMRAAVWFLVALLSFTAARAAEDQFEFEYSRWARITERLAGAGKYDRIIVRIRALVPGKQIEPKDLVFTILAKAGPREIRPDSEGYLTLPNDTALAKENPKVRANVPKSVEVRFGLIIRCRVTAGLAIPYAELSQCVDQMNDAIGEQAGMMSFMAPSAKGVRIRCGTDCVASLPGGAPPSIKADKDGNIDILNDVYRKTPNLTVTLSAPPTAVIPIVR
jgi:hypothetical protein